MWLQGTLSPELFQATFRVHDLFAARVTTLLEQIETSYALTARLQNLSLTKFL